MSNVWCFSGLLSAVASVSFMVLLDKHVIRPSYLLFLVYGLACIGIALCGSVYLKSRRRIWWENLAYWFNTLWTIFLIVEFLGIVAFFPRQQ